MLSCLNSFQLKKIKDSLITLKDMITLQNIKLFIKLDFIDSFITNDDDL